MKIYWIKAQAPRRVLALAKHLGIKAEFIEVDLMAGGLQAPDFAVLNPNRKAPVLVDGDQVLWKITVAPHPLGPTSVQAVHEAIAGTGKYAGISMTMKTTVQSENTGPMAYALKGEVTQ